MTDQVYNHAVDIAAPRPMSRTGARLGADISEFQGHVLLGDAFDLFDRLPAQSVDLIITSPPYWGHREYGLDHNWEMFNDIQAVKRHFRVQSEGYASYKERRGALGLEPYPEWYVSHLTEIFRKAQRCLKMSGSLWLNIGDTYFARWASIRENGRQGLADEGRLRRKTPMGGFRQEKQLLLIPARLAIAMQDDGWILRNDLIWHKPNATPRPEGDRLRLTHEHFFHFVRKPKEGRPAYFYDAQFAEPGLSDVVSVSVAPGEEGHTATFPKKLIAPRILSSSPPAGTVLDPFCGTGRALEVAKEFGRQVIGFEKFPEFLRIAQSKLISAGRTRRRD
jgi:DNA modification methylase